MGCGSEAFLVGGIGRKVPSFFLLCVLTICQVKLPGQSAVTKRLFSWLIDAFGRFDDGVDRCYLTCLLQRRFVSAVAAGWGDSATSGFWGECVTRSVVRGTDELAVHYC